MPATDHPDRLFQGFSSVTPGNCRDGTFNICTGRHLPESFPLPYPDLRLRCLKALNKIQIKKNQAFKYYRNVYEHTGNILLYTLDM